MARGQSPYQGRYTVPIHDYSAIERGGAAWGDAMQSVGQSIAGGIENYGLKKEEGKMVKSELMGWRNQAKGVLGEIQSGLYSSDTARNDRFTKTLKELSRAIDNDPNTNDKQKLERYKQGVTQVRQSLAALAAAPARERIELNIAELRRQTTPEARLRDITKEKDQATILSEQAKTAQRAGSPEAVKREKEAAIHKGKMDELALAEAQSKKEESQAQFAAQDRLASALQDPRFQDVTTPDQARVAKNALAALARENPKVLEATQYKNLMENFEDLASTPLSREEQQAEYDDITKDLPPESSFSITWSTDEDGFPKGSLTINAGKEKAEIRPVRMEVDKKMVPIPNVYTIEGREGFWRIKDGKYVQAGPNKTTALDSERIALKESISELEDQEIAEIRSADNIPMPLKEFEAFHSEAEAGNIEWDETPTIKYTYSVGEDEEDKTHYEIENPYRDADGNPRKFQPAWYQENMKQVLKLRDMRTKRIDLANRFTQPQTAGIPVPSSVQPPAAPQPVASPAPPTIPTPTNANAIKLINSGQFPSTPATPRRR